MRHLFEPIGGLVKKLAIRILGNDQLAAFQWYRRERGGYWTRSNSLGWRSLPDWSANLDLELARKSPEMYNGGRDVEDYRSPAPTQ